MMERNQWQFSSGVCSFDWRTSLSNLQIPESWTNSNHRFRDFRGFLKNRGTPSHHPSFRFGFSLSKTIQLLGITIFMETRFGDGDPKKSWNMGRVIHRRNRSSDAFDGFAAELRQKHLGIIEGLLFGLPKL